MRASLFLLLLWLLPLWGSGQGSAWVHVADSMGVGDYFYDGLWNGERYLLSRQTMLVNSEGSFSSVEVRSLAENGLLAGSTPFAQQQRFIASTILKRVGVNHSDLLAKAVLANDRWFVVRIGLNAQGEFADSTWVLGGNLDHLFAENAVRSYNGGIIMALAGTPAGSGAWSARQFILRFDAEGDSANMTAYDYPFGSIYPYDIIERSPDTILIATDGGIEAAGTAFNITSISALNQNFEPFAGMPMIVADGSGDPLGFFNSFTSRVHLLQLNGDTILVAGRMGTGGTGSRYGVMKVHWPTATWLGAYLPQSSYPADHPAVTQSTVLQDDGHVLVAYMENYQFNPSPYHPSAPNRLRIVRLDQDLNPICTNVIDGFAENAYYLLYRIKPMPDGGYLLLGGRWGFNSPEQDFAAWAQKLGPDECFTGIDDGLVISTAFAFPNPGSEAVRFTLNGPVRMARVELFDTHGKMMASNRLYHGQAEIDARALRSGMYFWRITDAKGSLLGSGKWVKE